MRVLDSHLHLWDPAVLTYAWLEGALHRRFGPIEHAVLLADDDGAITARGAVFVQAEADPAESLAEVDWVASSATDTGVLAIVARLAMEDGNAVFAALDALAERPLVHGVRRNIQGEAAGFATAAGFIAAGHAVAAAGLTFDACVQHHQLTELIEFADAVPELPIVLDHLGKPAVTGNPDRTWREQLTELARRDQVVCKLSGLPAETGNDWTPALLEPYLDAALEAFGPDRILFGSDWPVSGPYLAWERFVVGWASNTIPEHLDAVLWDTAARVYRV